MKKIGLWIMVSAVFILAGCENQELVTCRQDKEALVGKVDALQQDLDQTKSTLQQKDGEIAEARAKNVQMQTKAMESIMTMLKKEEERSKKLQATISAKDAELKTAQQKMADLQQTVDTLQKQLEEMPSADNSAGDTDEVAEQVQ